MSITHVLTTRQARFVQEYLVDGNGAAAAVRAGYSERSAKAIAAENLTKPDLQNAIKARQQADAVRLSLERADVLAGLKAAIDQAKAQSNPAAMISGWREIAKMMGYYVPEVKEVQLNPAGEGVMRRLELMSDAELLEIIEAGRSEVC